MSDLTEWLDRLRQIGEEDEPKASPLAPRLKSVVPKIESPLEFISNPPSRFVEFVESFGDAEFNFLYRNEDYFAYIATLTDSGEMVDSCVVKIFRGHKSRYLEEILEQYGITVVDDVIIYHDAFFSPALRRCQISMWAADALTQFCGFRFF